MLRPLLRLRALPRATLPPHLPRPFIPSRPIFSFLRRSSTPDASKPKAQAPLLTEDNLFHPFSKSPFPAIQARGEAIKKLAPCPVCYSVSSACGHDHSPKAVKFECPDCGWPTHCSEEHWKEDEEHHKYCTRLREANEDEHDLRSGRRMKEFELPGMFSFLFLLFPL